MKEFNELNLVITFVWAMALFQAGISVLNAFKTSPEIVDLSLPKPPSIQEVYFSNDNEQRKRAQEVRKAYDSSITSLKERISDNRNRLELR